MSFRVWAETHNGAVRTHNEDALISRPEIGLWAVADGAGGHDSGELASGMLVEALAALPADLSPDRLLTQVRLRVSDVHRALRAEAARRGPDAVIASTLVVLVVRGPHFACLWAGDSRVYLHRGGVLQQVTRDHSLVQELVDAGLIRADQAEHHPQANVITRAIGSEDDGLELDKVSGEAAPGDRFLLCSDGLCKTMDDMAIAAVMDDAADAPATALIAAALAAQSRDNVTAVVVKIAPADADTDADAGADEDATIVRNPLHPARKHIPPGPDGHA